MRFIYLISLFAFTGCKADHTQLVNDMESVAIGMLEVSQGMDCNDPNEVPDGDYECDYRGILSVQVYQTMLGEEDATDVVDIGFIGTQLDLVTVDGYGDLVIHDEGDQTALAGSLRIDDEREYEDLLIEVTVISEDEMHIEGVSDGLQFSFELIRFLDATDTEPQEDCGDLMLPSCE
jgi:hypothetical protein